MCVFKYHAFIYFLRPPPWYGTSLSVTSLPASLLSPFPTILTIQKYFFNLFSGALEEISDEKTHKEMYFVERWSYTTYTFLIVLMHENCLQRGNFELKKNLYIILNKKYFYKKHYLHGLMSYFLSNMLWNLMAKRALCNRVQITTIF